MSEEDGYKPLFDPDLDEQPLDEERMFRRGDERPRGGYVYDAGGRIALAVNVALATGRPLLIRGKPGTGKSSLAGDVADRLGWRSYRLTITSRTQSRDLLWSYDAVRRLNDANAGETLADPLAYITPGVLWWAFNAESAAGRGLSEGERADRGVPLLEDPSPGAGRHAVVLLDEIDKADPDLPNDLLAPLGALEFAMNEFGRGPTVKAQVQPLVVITTNEERDLPKAFLRRCVVLALPEPDRDRMLEVAHAHFGDEVDEDDLGGILDAFEAVRSERSAEEHEPGLAEFLDAVAAVAALRAGPDGEQRWQDVVEFTLRKPAPETTE
jgi:MoxR-like ATPase